MNATEELLTLDQAQQLVDFDSNSYLEDGPSTQQLLDELLGRHDDEALTGLTPDFCAASDE
jgi:hypothetical protein